MLLNTKIKRPRDLTEEEIELVAGGLGGNTDITIWGDDIVITGHRDKDNTFDPWSEVWDEFLYNYGNFDYGSGGGGGGSDAPSGNGITDEQRDKALNSIEAARALLQQALERYGPGTMADVNGRLLPVHELLQDLGRLAEVLQAGNLLYGLETGEKGLADAIGFLAGIAGVGLAAEAEIGVGLAALVGIVADKIVTAGAEQIKVVYNGAAEVINQEIETFVDNHSSPTFDPFDPSAWFDGLWGRPHDPYSGGGGPRTFETPYE